jgi:hypothetical protein
VLEEVAGDWQLAIAIGHAGGLQPGGAPGWDRLVALVQAPIFVAPEVLQEAEARRAGDPPEAARLRRALAAAPMTVGTVGMPSGDVGQRR